VQFEYPELDWTTWDSQLQDKICVAFAGRAAEQVKGYWDMRWMGMLWHQPGIRR
jgi:hypothetical protein